MPGSIVEAYVNLGIKFIETQFVLLLPKCLLSQKYSVEVHNTSWVQTRVSPLKNRVMLLWYIFVTRLMRHFHPSHTKSGLSSKEAHHTLL